MIQEQEVVSHRESKDTEFKVSRTRYWLQTGLGNMAIFLVGVVVGVGFAGVDVDDASEIVGKFIAPLMSLNSLIMIFGRQNDAGVSGLSRFNPFTNIKIAFCKTA
ncbi:hypothetical protein [Candidatus Endomicrobiellum trichonymphae]|uniref:hypothetical protein n=1 Tax=Endomicrobium trichonymphae TaxID=1408204 RepID=UPI0039B9C10C